LAHHASYELFEALDDLLVTGPTETNVNDFQAVLIAVAFEIADEHPAQRDVAALAVPGGGAGGKVQAACLIAVPAGDGDPAPGCARVARLILELGQCCALLGGPAGFAHARRHIVETEPHNHRGADPGDHGETPGLHP